MLRNTLTGRTVTGDEAKGVSFADAIVRDCVFDGADLAGNDFTGARFENSTFKGADLTGCTFSKCEITGCTFDEASLADADFTHAHVTRSTFIKVAAEEISLDESVFDTVAFDDANLAHASIWKASGRNVRLDGTNLKRSLIADCDIIGLSWNRANLSQGTVRALASVPGAEGADFSSTLFMECHFSGAVFRNTKFPLAVFQGGSCRGVRFENCDLTQLIADGLDLADSVFAACPAELISFAQADLSRAEFQAFKAPKSTWCGAKLVGAKIAKADLNMAVLSECDLTAADMHGTDLSMADLSHANVHLTNLSSANLRLANVHGTNLGDADSKGATTTDMRPTDKALLRAENFHLTRY